MSNKRNRSAQPSSDRETSRLTELEAAVRQREETILAQQQDIEEMREALRELTAPKPGRPFRARKIILGPLDIAIKGKDVAESEVRIEQVGGSLLIVLAGEESPLAIEKSAFPTGSGWREPYRQEPYREGTVTVAHTATTRDDLEARALRDVGLGSLSAVDTHGLGNGDPSIINAALAPQQDPRKPGGYQLHDGEVQSIAANQFGGWSGVGPKPAGWKDPAAAVEN